MLTPCGDYDSDRILLESIFEDSIKGRWFTVPNPLNDGARGDVFEALIGKQVDNLSKPDFGSIEVKTRKRSGASLITLASKVPTNGNKMRSLYGRDDLLPDGSTFKRLNATFGAVNWTDSKLNEFDFKLNVNHTTGRFEILIRDKNADMVSSSDFYWDFASIQKAISKLKHIVLVSCDVDREKSAVKFVGASFINAVTWETFLEAIKSGSMKVDIRMGAYKTGKKKGKLHDHGTGFRISQSNLLKI